MELGRDGLVTALGSGIAIATTANGALNQAQLFDVAGDGGLRNLKACLTQKLLQVLLSLHDVIIDNLQDFSVSSGLHTLISYR